MGQVIRQIIQKEGMGAFYKGLVASWAGIAPYAPTHPNPRVLRVPKPYTL